MEFRILGPLEVSEGERRILLRRQRERALLAVLLLRPGEVVSTDRLVDEVWGESPPPTARDALHNAVSQLRRTLGRDRIVTQPPGYALAAERSSVDAYRFAALARDGRSALAAGDPALAATTFREALALWRGPALAEFTYEPFAQVEIARLEELRHTCLEGRIGADLALGRHPELVGEVESLVAAEPLREHLRGLLMIALYRAGRQADALTVYRDAREQLLEELGIEPGRELRALEQAILRQDDSLLAPAPRAAAAPREQRKLVTILFADLVDSMGLAGRLDPEAFHRLLQRYFATVAAVLERHGASVEKFAGDAAMAAFGVPVAHEDDALRASRAALELRSAVTALDLELRVGIESGEVLAGDASAGQRFVTGETVGLAARLEQAAAPGEIVVGEAAARLIAHAAQLERRDALTLAGRADPLPAFRLAEVAPAAPAFERRLDAPIVGRERELARLRETLSQGPPRAVLVIGPAGIGKSRLAAELARRADATVLRGRCPSYGEGITYWPLQTIVPEAELAPMLALPSAGEIAWAFRLHCEALARERPVLLVLDDLHWAEPTFLELVEHVAARAEGPIVLLALAREDLLEERPGFLPDRLVLDPLAAGEIERMIDSLPGASALAGEARARVVEAAEGNPLFVEQLIAYAAEEGGLGAERPLPRSIRALLAARLDRLGPGERAVLERAAVVGKEFRREEVAGLLEPEAAATVGRHLGTLAARGFVRGGVEDDFRFRHALIQEAVYRATPKGERASLHERFADRLVADPEDLDELVGYHLERSYRLRVELGPPDRAVRQLAADAGARLGAAGLRASRRSDIPAAVNLLWRATALLPEDDPERRGLGCELGTALRAGGDTDGAEAALHEALAGSARARDGRIELRARLELAYSALLHEARRGPDELLELAGTAIPTLETLGDDRALGRAWLLVGFAQGGVRGRHAVWEDAAERALVHYRKAGWPAATCLGQIAAALYYGPAPVERAIARCEELLGDESAGRAGEANVLAFLGGLRAMQGRFDEARRDISRAAAVFDELGQVGAATIACGAVTGDVALWSGDDAAAQAVLADVCNELERIGDRNHLATRAADLGEALYRQGRYEEAESWAAISARNAAPDDRSAQPLWRCLKAKLLARSGTFGEAESLALEARRIASATDAPNLRARVALDASEVLRAAGRLDEASELVEEAARLYESKGNAAGVARLPASAKARSGAFA